MSNYRDFVECAFDAEAYGLVLARVAEKREWDADRARILGLAVRLERMWNPDDILELKYLNGDPREFPGSAGMLVFAEVNRAKRETLGTMQEMIDFLRRADIPSEFDSHVPKLRAYFEAVEREARRQVARYGPYARGKSLRGEAVRAN